KHQATMSSIRNRVSNLNLVGGLLRGAQNITLAAAGGGASSLGSNGGGSISSVLDLGLHLFQRHYQEQLQDENDKYEAEVLAAQGNDRLQACKHTAEQMKPSIDAALDASARAALETQAALFAIGNNMNAVTGIVQAAKGQIALEDTINRTPPQ